MCGGGDPTRRTPIHRSKASAPAHCREVGGVEVSIYYSRSRGAESIKQTDVGGRSRESGDEGESITLALPAARAARRLKATSSWRSRNGRGHEIRANRTGVLPRVNQTPAPPRPRSDHGMVLREQNVTKISAS